VLHEIRKDRKYQTYIPRNKFTLRILQGKEEEVVMIITYGKFIVIHVE
jgi:hypothetical protein